MNRNTTTCAGCNGNGEVGGLTHDGYDSQECPFCKGTGKESAAAPATGAQQLASEIKDAICELGGSSYPDLLAAVDKLASTQAAAPATGAQWVACPECLTGFIAEEHPLLDHPPRASAQAEPSEVEQKYEELIYAVGRKYPGESRHETALRYIHQAEQSAGQRPEAPKETPK